ncbi:MAG: dihydrofolate reductase [Parvibaculaceae bacterium]
MHISFVVAIAENSVIGQGGDLPWKISGDMKHFKAVTLGKPIIMGRKTWESFPRRPLPGRPNLIVTRNADYDAPGGEVFTSVEAALARAKELCGELGVDEIMILGGAEIYAATLPMADRIYLTRVHASPEGDTSFPDFDPADWKEVRNVRQPKDEGDSDEYSLIVLERV